MKTLTNVTARATRSGKWWLSMFLKFPDSSVLHPNESAH